MSWILVVASSRDNSSISDQPTKGCNSPSICSIVLRNTGSVSSRSLPIWNVCGPCPQNTNATGVAALRASPVCSVERDSSARNAVSCSRTSFFVAATRPSRCSKCERRFAAVNPISASGADASSSSRNAIQFSASCLRVVSLRALNTNGCCDGVAAWPFFSAVV